MKSSTKKLKSKTEKSVFPYTKLIVVVMSFFVLFIIGSSIATAYQYKYKDSIYPGIYINDIHIGGMKTSEAEDLIQKQLDVFREDGFVYQYKDQKINILPTVLSPSDPDLTYELLHWPSKETINKAYKMGRSQSWILNLTQPLTIRFTNKQIAPGIELDTELLTEILQNNFSKFETPVTEPEITWSLNKPTIIPGIPGEIFDYKSAIKKSHQNVKEFNNKIITLNKQKRNPSVNIADITNQTYDQLTTLGHTRPVLIWKTKKRNWTYSFYEYQDYIKIFNDSDKKLSIMLDTKWLEEKLKNIKTALDNPGQDARFSIEDGRVIEFQESQDGIVVDLETNLEQVQNNFKTNLYTMDVIMSIDRAKIQTSDVNDLGIKEIIGIGESDFSGSPSNRRVNIGVGADSLDGLLIKPGEEFSLIDALLPIDGTTGYLQELVIKGDKTIPEYGGGLCQIGTTAFRGALNSGLKITQRKNHSYRVSYYEPAGTDATIYDPAPDFRFLNDTPAHVLLQTRMEGDKMIFEFWGTKDGRIINVAEPKIFNITTPPPTKYIDSTDIPPGDIKCTESAHNGATAELDYEVTYADGKIHEETFTSYYRPWQEVCLRGIDPDAATSTEIITE